MLLAVLALFTFARAGEPVWQEPDILVAKRHVVQVDLVIVDRFVRVLACDRLDDELALDLEEDVVGRERPHGLLGDVIEARWDGATAVAGDDERLLVLARLSE